MKSLKLKKLHTKLEVRFGCIMHKFSNTIPQKEALADREKIVSLDGDDDDDEDFKTVVLTLQGPC